MNKEDQTMDDVSKNPQLSAQEQRDIRLKRLAEQKSVNVMNQSETQQDSNNFAKSMPQGF